MEKFNFLLDEKTGFEYLEELPEGYVQASLDDFHVQGKKKIDMIYFIRGYDWKVFFLKKVDKHLTGEKLNPFIKNGQVFVKKITT